MLSEFSLSVLCGIQPFIVFGRAAYTLARVMIFRVINHSILMSFLLRSRVVYRVLLFDSNVLITLSNLTSFDRFASSTNCFVVSVLLCLYFTDDLSGLLSLKVI